MFKSIGLNIDNPETFYVGQGKITKIAGFKPEDLVTLVNEAAGTAYYEEVASKSTKLLDKITQENETCNTRIEKNLGKKLRKNNQDKENLQVFKEFEREREIIKMNLEEAQVRDYQNRLEESEQQFIDLEEQQKVLLIKKRDLENKKRDILAQQNNNDEEDEEEKQKIKIMEEEIERTESDIKESEKELKNKLDTLKTIQNSIVSREKNLEDLNEDLEIQQDKKSKIENEKEKASDQQVKAQQDHREIKQNIQNIQVQLNNKSNNEGLIEFHEKLERQEAAKIKQIEEKIKSKETLRDNIEDRHQRMKTDKSSQEDRIQEQLNTIRRIKEQMSQMEDLVRKKNSKNLDRSNL